MLELFMLLQDRSKFGIRKMIRIHPSNGGSSERAGEVGCHGSAGEVKDNWNGRQASSLQMLTFIAAGHEYEDEVLDKTGVTFMGTYGKRLRGGNCRSLLSR